MSGQAKSFQLAMSVSSVSTAISGLHSGSTTCRKMRMCPAPSMRAASMSSSGMPMKNCRARKMPKAAAAPGRITPQYVP